MSTLTRAITFGLVVAAIAGGVWLIGDRSGTDRSETAPERPPVEEMTKEATRSTEEDPDARRT
jgi:Na+/glutamate symporter